MPIPAISPRAAAAALVTSFEKISSSFKNVLISIKNLAKRFFSWVASFFSRREGKPVGDPVHQPVGFKSVPHNKIGFENYRLFTDKQLLGKPNVVVENVEEKNVPLKQLEQQAIIKVVGLNEYNRVQEEIGKLEFDQNGVIACYNITQEQENRLFNDLPLIALKIVNENIENNKNNFIGKAYYEKQKNALIQKFPHLANE